ncbi:unnamed protein product (macronuclear) [Paramecium tetraurelia]|uniref:B box-type domain-containing protein n=1 Tax=Paramecium tetraurelia TaxID=5888 RepID=A0BGF5_PARTE|nr:uncharacterized protein GSPATT00028657001 [Paramecium tetraurelia]CAK57622.1 unnamed protein product [Paramecium tetraurelia]|eukprot:XP_001425020.1 hypothetical protein (macronuclear) [Paramecium tetraurelia strain d4-2]
MQNFHYQSCNIAEHEEEFLNMVCIDEKCNKHQLLCVYCMEEHQSCIKHPVKKFLRDFKSQLHSQNAELSPKIDDLIAFYDQIKITMEQAQKQLNEMFEKSKQTILDTKKMIGQFSQQETAKSVQMQKLKEFESTSNQENFFQLLTEIESFKPNPDRFSFSIKKIQGHQIDLIQERIANGKIHSQQYQTAITNFVESFVNQHEALKKNLQNYFLNAPKRPFEQESNEGKQSKQSNPLSLIQQPSLDVQDKSIIAIDDDLEEIEKNNRNNENSNNKIKKQNNNNNNTITNNNQNNVQNNTPLNLNNLGHQNNYQKTQDSQISITDILDSNSSKKQTIQDNKSNYTSNLKQQSYNNKTKQAPPQPLSQTTPYQKQPASNGSIPIPPKQAPLPLQQSPLKDAFQEDNQGEVETVLNVSQDHNFQLVQNGKEITKLLILSKTVVAGCGGNLFQGFDISTCQKLFTLNVDSDITDVAYLETDDCNGTLYLATKKGKIETFIRESNSENPFTFRSNSSQIVDKYGNLLIQINQQEKQLVTLGEEKIIRILPVKTLRESKRCEIQEVGTALHVDSKYVYVGGNKFLFIWDSATQAKKKIQMSDINLKVISIQTYENKLVVGLQDKIKIFERKTNDDYQLIHEQAFGDISSMHILKQWPIVLISCTQQLQQKICLYNYEQDSSEKLHDQKATSCVVREFDKVYHVAFGQEKGQCIIYKIEQTQQQQSQ